MKFIERLTSCNVKINILFKFLVGVAYLGVRTVDRLVIIDML